MIRLIAHQGREPHAARIHSGVVAFDNMLKQSPGVEVTLIERDGVVFDARDVEQILDDAFETPGFTLDRVQVLAALLRRQRDVGNPKRFDIAAHRGQRRLEFV